MSRQGRRVLFTKCQNKLGAFIRPNSITKYLNSLYQVRNIVSYLSPSIIQRRLNIWIISSFVQMRALLSRFSVSQINGIRYQFLTVIALRAQQSIQKRKPLLGFLIKITSAAIGKELALINSLSRCSSKYFRSTLSLFQDILYRGPNLGSFPSSIIILQLYSQRSSNLLASSYKNTSRYLWYSTSTFIAGLVCFFGAKAFLILAIIIAKIVCLGFIVSYANRVALIMQTSKVLGLFGSSIVSYLGLGLVLDIELVLDLGSGSLSILFIVGYQSFQYFRVLSLSFYLVWGGVVVRVSLQGLVGILDPQWILVEFLYWWNSVEFLGWQNLVDSLGAGQMLVEILRLQNLVEFLGQQNLVDSLGIGQILVEILDQQILVDFLDFISGLGLGRYIIRYFYL